MLCDTQLGYCHHVSLAAPVTKAMSHSCAAQNWMKIFSDHLLALCLCTTVTLKKKTEKYQDWRDGLAVKSTCCFTEDLGAVLSTQMAAHK